MNNQLDRRDRTRLPGQVLYIKIGLQPFPIIDISAGGVGFEAEGYSIGDVVSLSLVSVLDALDYVTANCQVVQVDGFRVAARFIDTPDALQAYIVRYVEQWS